jgi:multidrug resistance efflux pump
MIADRQKEFEEFMKTQQGDYQKLLDAATNKYEQRIANYKDSIDKFRQEQQQQRLLDQQRAEEEAQNRKLAAETAMGNAARAGQQADLRIGSVEGGIGGTSGFKRRRRLPMMTGIGGALAGMQNSMGLTGGMLNV